jgi:hypothetical protein
MYPHHQRTIQRLIDRFQPDPTVLALIIIGSVARGEARADSDVDCLLLVTDASYQARRAANQLSINADDLCDDPQGQAGGRVIDLAYLQDVAARGPEPARFAFVQAFPAFARWPSRPASSSWPSSYSCTPTLPWRRPSASASSSSSPGPSRPKAR